MKKPCTLIACLLASIAIRAAERPNVLLIFADDWGRHASAYASVEGPGSVNDAISTPNFDRLADSGVLFLNSYVNSPSCTPCRSSLLAGQYFWRTAHGAILRGATWDPAIPSWPLLLEESGYDIGYCYKVWSPGTPVNAPICENRTRFENAGRRFNSFYQTADT